MKQINLFWTAALLLGCAGSLIGQAPIAAMPAGADPGKCYAQCLIPDQLQTVTERILVKPATTRVEIIPAVYETVTERIMTKEPSKRFVAPLITDQVYEKETVSIETREASVRYEYVPAIYETTMEQVMVKEASVRYIPRPAVFRTVEEQVLVQPETRRTTTIPAVYQTASREVEVREPSFELERVDALYENVTERVEISPASTKWVRRQTDPNCLAADPEDCLVWCLVEVPAEYQYITKKVRVGCPDGFEDTGEDCIKRRPISSEFKTIPVQQVATEARRGEEVQPPVYKTIKRRVVDIPASYETEEIPAEYQIIPVQRVVEPATIREAPVPSEFTDVQIKRLKPGAEAELAGEEETLPAEYTTYTHRVVKTPATTRVVEVPAEYVTVTRQELVKKGGFTEWREVVCADKLTSTTIRRIQESLKGFGFDPGPADNVLGVKTKAALTSFQREKGLPVGQLDFETLTALGVELR